MRLAFCLFRYFPFGGLERNFAGIAQSCVARGHRVRVYTMIWEGKPIAGLEVVPLPSKGWSNHGRCRAFTEALRQKDLPSKHDLVVGFNRMPGLDLYYCADVCFIAAQTRRRPAFVRFTPRYRWYARFENAVFSPHATTEIMYLSEAEKKRYIEAYGTPEKRFHYLPPGVDKQGIQSCLNSSVRDSVRHALGLMAEDVMLLMVGSGFKTKGVARAIASLASLPEALRRRTHLYVIGKGNPESYLRKAARNSVGDRVHFLGTCHDVPRYLASADLLLHPSVQENTGNAIVEALVAGLPVLATEACGFGEHVVKAGAGYLIAEPFTQQEMNQLLARVLAMDPYQRSCLRDHALDYSARTDLYGRFPKAVAIIEALAGRLRHAKRQ